MSDTAATTRRIVGPFNRVEGDLEVRLEIAGGHVRAASVHSPLYRGFEQILEGKAPLDALVLAPRICGICSVAQSAAAARALADAAEIRATDNGRRVANLCLAIENLADHLTHFYLFFMPDFAADAYRNRCWYPDVAVRFAAKSGEAVREALAARAQWLSALGILAGKWPHTLALQPGGTTRPLTSSDLFRLMRIVRTFRTFLENRLFDARLETVAELDGLAALARWRQQGSGDLRRFLDLADWLDLWGVGESGGDFLCGGAYAEEEGCLFPPGVFRDGEVHPFDPAAIREDLAHAYYAASAQPVSPAQGVTVPLIEKPAAYSWCKAPRLAGRIAETGALARQLVSGHPLLREVLARHGAGVAARVLARLFEFCRVVPAIERWLAEIEPEGAWCHPFPSPAEAPGLGIVEAARGMLGHWLTIRGGCLERYQIVSPTTWNFSPRDSVGQPGPLEAALVGLAVPEEGRTPMIVHHVVRSFDPCMVCTVH